MKVMMELDSADALSVGMTLRALAHASPADPSATERLERVGAIMVAAKPAPEPAFTKLEALTREPAVRKAADFYAAASTAAPEDVNAAERGAFIAGADWEKEQRGSGAVAVVGLMARALGLMPGDAEKSAEMRAKLNDLRLEVALVRVAELEAQIATNAPLVTAALATERAREALEACGLAWEVDAKAERDSAESRRKFMNAHLWLSTCVAAESAVAKRHAAPAAPKPAGSILRIVHGDACVTAEAITGLDAHGVGGWAFVCQGCEATWTQPDSSDVTAIDHMLRGHALSHEWTPLYHQAAVERCIHCPAERLRAGDSFHYRPVNTSLTWDDAQPECVVRERAAEAADAD